MGIGLIAGWFGTDTEGPGVGFVLLPIGVVVLLTGHIFTRVIIAVVALGIALALFVDSTAPSTSETETFVDSTAEQAPPSYSESAPAQEPSIAYKLAVIHSSGYVSEDDPLVAAFATALDRLEAKCPEDRQMLADMGVRTQQLLTNDGVNESLLEVFQNLLAMAIAADGVLGPDGCKEIFALYATMRGAQ
jgi:hypothetical protein